MSLSTAHNKSAFRRMDESAAFTLEASPLPVISEASELKLLVVAQLRQDYSLGHGGFQG